MVNRLMDRMEQHDQKKMEHVRDTRTNKIQTAVGVTNYMADKERALAVGKGALATGNIALDVSTGNYWGAALQGAKLAKGTGEEVFRTAPIWS